MADATRSFQGSAQAPADEQTLGQLFASASRDFSTIIRSEIELAKAEVRQGVKGAAVGGGLFAVAGVLALMAFMMLTVSLAFGISALGLPLGWGFFIVAMVYLLVTGLLALVGLKLVTRLGPPERAIATSKESIATLKRKKSQTIEGVMVPTEPAPASVPATTPAPALPAAERAGSSGSVDRTPARV
jgi:hypothetical protein